MSIELDESRKILDPGIDIFSRAMEQCPLAMVITDRQGKISFINEKFCQISGYRSEELLGQAAEVLGSGEFSSENEEAMWNTLLDGKEWKGVFHNRKKTGESYWATQVINPIRDQEGQITHFLGVVEIINYFEEAEQSIKTQLSFLQNLIDAIPVPVYYKNLDGVYIGCNVAFETFLGKPKEAIVGKTAFDLFPLDQAGVFRQKDLETLNCGSILTHESIILVNDEDRNVIFNKAIFTGIGNKSRGLVGTILDITERKKIEEEMRETNHVLRVEIGLRHSIQYLLAREKELLSTTLMSIENGVVCTDCQGNISLYNRAAEAILGYHAGEAIGQPLESVLKLRDGQTGEVLTNVLEELQLRDKLARQDLLYRPSLIETKNGQVRMVSGNISQVLGEDQTIYGYVIVIQDITERIRSESEKALSNKMEAIGQLAAGIAHEINTPIQYVGLNLNFIEQAFARYQEQCEGYEVFIHNHLGHSIEATDVAHLHEQHNHKKIEFYRQEVPGAIQESLDGIERVRKIVLAIREFSHPSEKDMKFSDLNHGILTTITISRNEWKYSADMETDLDPTLPPVYCQIDEINQVILNIIINAAHAIQTAKGKDATEKGLIQIISRRNGDNARVSIHDNGCGIPENIIDRIFEPFFTTKDVGQGTGQGLYLAHNVIVKKHQGKIDVDSTVGKGSTFTIEIPIGGDGLII